MRIHRTAPLLQCAADLRNWFVHNIPGATTLVGYDLFLKIGNDYLTDQPLELSSIVLALPHTQEMVLFEIQEMEKAGLLVLTANGGTGRAIAPTQQFIALLGNYQRKFESLFIHRGELRRQHLLVASGDPELRRLAESLYDHFYDLGWLYLHNYGAVCFLMASLVKKVAGLYGYKAEIKSGYVEIASPSARFLLGAQGYAAPGQIDGHAMCVIEDALLIDFGLGNVRKSYRRDFFGALACDYQPNENILAKMMLPSGESVTWKNDWQSPNSAEELKNYEPLVEQLSRHYLSYFA
jgi:hypothetical protein